MVTAGVDIGSLTTDVVILSGDQMLSYTIVPTLSSSEAAAVSAYESALTLAGISAADVQGVVATGYGRTSIDFADKAITEITCHALGARRLFAEARTVIDIGGQDSKVIRLADDGRVEDFSMNDKCAAGTGRFLEVMARSLDTSLDSLGSLSVLSSADLRISSTCTVFAESEVVALVAKGVPKEDIIRGLHRSVAERVYAMITRLRAEPPFVMTGGVAKNSGVVAALEERLGTESLLPEEPQIVGALGAATAAQSACYPAGFLSNNRM
jgi:(R)-2-hydroxyacyl-CoA dehydratese activating ATPase